MTRPSTRITLFVLVALLVAGVVLATPALSQSYQTQSYGYSEVQPRGAAPPLLFGVASHKICQIKTFLFAAVYILGAIAFVIFAVRALFAKFEMKHFFPILGALFIAGTADLFIAWISDDAYFCPSTFQQLNR